MFIPGMGAMAGTAKGPTVTTTSCRDESVARVREESGTVRDASVTRPSSNITFFPY
jgi:hypothetical protein